MKDCEYQTPDDHPCPDAGVIKVGTKHYCQFHAAEVVEDSWDIDEEEY